MSNVADPEPEPIDERLEAWVRQNPYLIFESPEEATSAFVVAARRGLQLRLPNNVEGTCSSCGAVIEMRPETAALPHARLCVECAVAGRRNDVATGAF